MMGGERFKFGCCAPLLCHFLSMVELDELRSNYLR